MILSKENLLYSSVSVFIIPKVHLKTRYQGKKHVQKNFKNKMKLFKLE